MTGASVNLAFRLLEAAVLKEALAGSPGVLTVIASSWFFEEVVRHGDAHSLVRPGRGGREGDHNGRLFACRITLTRQARRRCGCCRVLAGQYPGAEASWPPYRIDR